MGQHTHEPHHRLRSFVPLGLHSAGASFTARAGTTIACVGSANRRGATRFASCSRAYLWHTHAHAPPPSARAADERRKCAENTRGRANASARKFEKSRCRGGQRALVCASDSQARSLAQAREATTRLQGLRGPQVHVSVKRVRGGDVAERRVAERVDRKRAVLARRRHAKRHHAPLRERRPCWPSFA